MKRSANSVINPSIIITGRCAKSASFAASTNNSPLRESVKESKSAERHKGINPYANQSIFFCHACLTGIVKRNPARSAGVARLKRLIPSVVMPPKPNKRA